jgi:hypothetical protein
MGMFDSLKIELDGNELDIQTKRFDCILQTYRPGDWIAGATSRIAVYFDILHIDTNGKLVYSEEYARTLTLFVIVAHGVFVAYQLCDGALTPEAINQKVRQLRDEWRDSARLLSVLVEALQTKQRQIQLLQARLNRVAGVIETSRRHRSGDSLTGIFDQFREETQRLAKGDDPLEVLTWVLTNDEVETGLWCDNTRSDLLADYRL